jgi:hypothetical protein
MRRRTGWSLIALGLLLVVKLVLGMVVTVQVPLWSAYHHEVDSYNIARLMVEERRLPRPDDFPPGQFEVRQGSQPPLYGLLATPIVRAFGDEGRVSLEQNPAPFCINGDVMVVGFETDRSYNLPASGHARGGYAFRLLNVSYGILAVAFLFIAARIAFPAHPAIAVVAAGLLAFEPYTVLLNSTIINDNLLLMVAAAHLIPMTALLRSNRVQVWSTALLILTSVLAVQTKINGWVTVAVSLLVIIWVIVRNHGGLRPSRRTWIAVGSVVGIGAIGILALIAFNLLQYGTILGRYDISRLFYAIQLNYDKALASAPPTLSYSLNDYANALRDIGLPDWFQSGYRLGGVILLMIAVWGGVAAALRRNRQVLQVIGFTALIFLGAMSLVLLRSAQSQIGTNVNSLIFAPVRYYAVALPALMLMLSYGFFAILPERASRLNPLGLLMVAAWLGLSVMNAAYNIPGQLLREGRTPLQETPPSDASLSLLEANFAPEDDVLNTTLTMWSDGTLDENMRGQIDLRGANDVSFSCSFVPLRGVYPTTRWEPDETVTERIALENCAAPMTAPVEVRFSWLGEDGTLTTVHQTTIDALLPTGSTCPSNLGTVGNELQLTTIKTPPEAIIGRGYEPLVSWIVLEQPLQAQNRTFTLTHTETSEQYTCTGFADVHSGVLSTQEFGDLRRAIPRGLPIYADGCVVFIPPEASAGVYTIDVMLSDSEGDPLTVILPDGSVASDNRLVLDTVTVRHD